MMQKMRCHPDLGGDEDRAKQLNLAVSVLCNAAQRSEHDKNLATGQASNEPTADTSSRDGKSGMSETADSRHRQKSENQRSPRYKPPPDSAKDQCSLPIKPGCRFCHCTRAQMTLDSPYTNAKSDSCHVCGSAATPIGAIKASDTGELRRLHRQVYTMKAQYWQRWPQPTPAIGVITDFSPVGCAVKCADQLANGHILKVETALFRAVCEVCDCRTDSQSDEFTLGLAFINLDLRANPGSLLNTEA